QDSGNRLGTFIDSDDRFQGAPFRARSMVILVLSAGLLAFVSLITLSGYRPSYVAACIFGFVAALGGLCLGSWVLFLNGCLVGGVAFGSHVKQVPPRKFLFRSFAATVVVYLGAFVYFAIFEERKWAKLEARYPVESLTERLQYEKEARKLAPPQSAAALANAERLAAFEAWMAEPYFEAYPREVSLRQLHASSVQRFIDSQGFGVGRMIIRPAPDEVELPEPEPISLPVYPDTS